MRACPDIQTAVSFLTTRVKSPDVDDWGKLRYCLQYLKGTRHMKQYPLAESLSHIQWYVDAPYGVHLDSKVHTGVMMTMGLRALINRCPVKSSLRKTRKKKGKRKTGKLISA